ncbi:MAG: CRTAC1 family protein [Phycisphaerales bacterium]
MTLPNLAPHCARSRSQKFTAALVASLAMSLGMHTAIAEPQAPTFEDVSEKLGILAHTKNWQLGHGAAWGDANGDGRPDLYLGAFADRPVFRQPDAPLPNMLLLNEAAGFTLSPDEAVRLDKKNARTTFAAFADIDNDGDQDLIAGNHERGRGIYPSAFFENQGDGSYVDITEKVVGFPQPSEERTIALIDVDQDGRLDMIVTDGAYGRQGGNRGRTVVLRQTKPWHFEDITAELGMPDTGTTGYGMALGDVNNDGRTDFFIAQANRLFVSTAEGKFVEADAGRFLQPTGGDRESLTCGAAFGDLNGDGQLDLVTTVHSGPNQMRVYLHDGFDDKGLPRFRHATKELGLPEFWPTKGRTGLAVKGAHIAIRDVDLDGRNDIMCAMVWDHPELGTQPVMAMNRNADNSEGFKLELPPLDRLLGYYAPGPVADYDRDGLIDMLLPAWFTELPTALFRNTTSATGHYLGISVQGDGKAFNRDGIGATVRLYTPGHAGDPAHLIARSDITSGNGYSSGEVPLAHFGLGDVPAVDMVITWQGKTITRKAVEANQYLTIAEQWTEEK